MTCASCAARVERKLNRLDGVTATVNFATEAARVSFPETLDRRRPHRGGGAHRLHRRAARAARCRAGRGRRGRVAPGAAPADASFASRSPSPSCCWRWSPRCGSAGWRWVSLAAATPVATWGAWPFHRAALVSARHGAATMDTLVSLGRVRRLSVVAVRAVPGRRRARTPPTWRWPSGVTALILLGRYLEARAKRSAGAALRALLDLGAKQATVLRDGREVSVPADQLAGGRRVRRPAGGEDIGRRHRHRGQLGGGRLDADRGAGAGRGRPGRRGDRRLRERRRPPRGAGHPGRGGHRARPARPARHPGAGGQGARAAARGPGSARSSSRPCS